MCRLLLSHISRRPFLSWYPSRSFRPISHTQHHRIHNLRLFRYVSVFTATVVAHRFRHQSPTKNLSRYYNLKASNSPPVPSPNLDFLLSKRRVDNMSALRDSTILLSFVPILLNLYPIWGICPKVSGIYEIHCS